MAAVGALQQIHVPPQAVAIDVHLQDQRVAEVSKGIFARAKETAVRIWQATIIGFQVAGDKISFVFFRVLEWIHPSLGPKIENVFLRVTNIWQAIKDAWRQEEVRKQIADLQVQNHELQVRTRDYEQIVFQKGQLTEERDRFQQENQALLHAKNFAEDALRIARQQEQNIIGREQAVVQYRDVVVLKNQQLDQANQQLIRERDEAKQALAVFLAGNQNLLQQLAAAKQQILDLQQLIPDQREMGQQFAVVANALGKVQRYGKTELDDGLEGLLPLLRAQIALAYAKLDELTKHRPNPLKPQEMLPPLVEPLSPTGIALGSFRRIMGMVEGYITQVTTVMQLHGNFQQPVNRLLLNLQPIAV